MFPSRLAVRARRSALLICLGACISSDQKAFADQKTMPMGIMRGELLLIEPGQILVRNSDGFDYGCTWDHRTYFEREKLKATPAALKVGDPVEVVADRRSTAGGCYTRMVHVVDSRAQRAPRSRTIDYLAPRGDLIVSGTVLRCTARSLLVRTRDGNQTLLLRADTRFIGDGLRLAAADLPVNTRVFVRAGKNLDSEVEAYQIVWGSIIRPKE